MAEASAVTYFIYFTKVFTSAVELLSSAEELGNPEIRHMKGIPALNS